MCHQKNPHFEPFWPWGSRCDLWFLYNNHGYLFARIRKTCLNLFNVLYMLQSICIYIYSLPSWKLRMARTKSTANANRDGFLFLRGVGIGWDEGKVA